MKVLVVGSGGREHALCWKLAQTAEVFAVPGNPGIASVATLREGSLVDGDHLTAICRDDNIDLVVFGPERPLIAGMADRLRAEGVAVYGPSAVCAQIEGSKAVAKQMMEECGVPTGGYATFSDFGAAKEYIEKESAAGREVVVKVSGEALGKGVVVPEGAEEAIRAAHGMLVGREFGVAGEVILVEERLRGNEVSLIAICSGEQYCVLPSAQDYKAALDGGRGPNTGGMGAVSPAPGIDESTFTSWANLFISPILREFAARGTPYIGTLYAGLMVTEDGPRALEYNARFGDPETQATLPRIKSDLAAVLMAAATGGALPKLEVAAETAVTVVLSAPGYPGEYTRSIPVPSTQDCENVIIYHAGTSYDGSRIVSSGGRVLNVTALGSSTSEAADLVYGTIDGRFNENWHYRRDVGR